MSFICCIINLFRIIYAQELWNFNCNIKSNSSFFFKSTVFCVTNVRSFSLQFYKKKFMLSVNVKVKLKKIKQCQFV